MWERNLKIEVAWFQIQPKQVKIYSEWVDSRNESQWMEKEILRGGIFLLNWLKRIFTEGRPRWSYWGWSNVLAREFFVNWLRRILAETVQCRPIDEGEKGEWKSWLKIQPSKPKIVASGSITSWQIAGEEVEIMTDFIFLDSKITVYGDCSHEIQRCLLLGKKAMTNLGSILKSRDLTLLIKVHLVRAMVFPGVMYGCERWAKYWSFSFSISPSNEYSGFIYFRID